MRRSPLVVALVCVSSLVVRYADASTEAPGLYDARSVAMGGTGGAYIENASSVYHNPAALDGVKRLAITAVLSPMAPRLKSPVAGPNTEVKSDFSFFPLFLVGGAYRVAERVVVGFAAYPTAGFGAKYTGVSIMGSPPSDFEFSIVAMEASPAVSYALSDKVAIGAGYRVTWTMEKQSVPASPNGPAVDQTMSGFSFLGAHFGIYLRPNPNVSVALTYRTKTSSKLTGTTTIGGADLDTKMRFATPHVLKLATAFRAFEQKMLFAIDLKYLLYKESNKELVQTLETPAGPMDQTIPLNWKNVLAVNTGLEYWFVSDFAGRVGYTIQRSSVPKDGATYFTPPPSILHSIHAGVGVKLSNWDLDLGGDYSFGGADAFNNNPPSFPGRYSIANMLASVSATYHSD
jgi:long-subunit fatty acid transport protein